MTTHRDELEKQDWNRILRRLTDYARWCLGFDGKIEDAEEIASEAVRIVFDPQRRNWDPAKDDLIWHLQSNVNGIISNRRAKKALSKERLLDFPAETTDSRFHSENPGVARLEQRNLLEAAHDHAGKLGDTHVQTLVLEALDGNVDAKDIAAKLNVEPQKIYDARQRLKKYLLAILREKEV